MTNRAETIMDTVASTLTGLATTGSNVTRGRVYPIESSGLPALSVFQGAETIVDEQNLSAVTRELTVNIAIHAKPASGLDTQINQVRAEIYAALMADYTQGLGYVLNTQWREDDPPEYSDDQENGSARAVSTWSILYRHSYSSVEA